MICKKKKIKYIYVFLLSLILVCGLLQSSALSCNTYASSGVTVEQFLQSQDFYDVCAWYYRKIGSIPDAYGGGSGFTFNAFADYLESKDKGYLLQEQVVETETNEASGGRGYDLPQEARQEIINYITENYVEEEPLSYKMAYIKSYNYISPNQFSNIRQYEAVKNFVKNSNGYCYLKGTLSYGNLDKVIITVIPHSVTSWALLGDVLNGNFSNVSTTINWQTNNNYMQLDSSIHEYYVNPDGSSGTWDRGVGNNPVHNSNNVPTDQSSCIYTNLSDSEIVYVFNTLQAYKNYNAGLPQPYYLLDDPETIAPISDPVTVSDLQKAGNFYNSIVNNVNTGDSPNDVQKTVKNGLLGGLLDTLTGSNSTVAGDNGNFDMSFLGTIKDLVVGVTGAIDPAEQLINNDLKRFVTDVFGWLPEELVIFWTAGIIFAVFFGILKIVRG